MRPSYKWTAMLWKSYFDRGYGITSYLKYFIAFFGLTSRDVKTTFIIGIIYGLSCFLIGWLWYRYGLVETETEISNRFNPFVKEVRNGTTVIRSADK